MSATKVKNSHNKNTNSNTPFNFRPIALAIALAFNGSIAGTANAATFIVNNTNDSGTGSLRQAVINANATPGADIIQFTTSPGSIIGLDSEIMISDTLTIKGPTAGDADSVILDGGGNNRLFSADDAGNNLDTITLENMTLRNGNPNQRYSFESGGAIKTVSTDLVINHSKILNNSTTTNFSIGTASGGGIFVSFGDLTLSQSTVSGNSTNAKGGGISQHFGELTLNNSIISNNTAKDTTDGLGGGISSSSSKINLNKSTVSGNIAYGGGGGISATDTSIYTNQTTISNNQAAGEFASSKQGGGIKLVGGKISILQSTISGNSASGDGGGIFLQSSNEANYIIQSTITSNSAFYFGTGVGISINNSDGANGILNLTNTIMSGNKTDLSSDIRKSVGNTGSLVINSTNNLLGDSSLFQINGSNVNTIFTNDPLLGPLGNNGGATLTHLLQTTSPAIDSAENSILFFLTEDQRGEGYPRFNPDSAGVDIGATELQANDSIFSFDIDDDGQIAPLTDGLLVLRYLFGFRGASLIDNAIASGATRNTASDIESYLQTAVDNKRLDIDGNNEVKPLTDGLLVLRYQFGFRGNSLIQNAIGTGATRNTAVAIENFLQ